MVEMTSLCLLIVFLHLISVLFLSISIITWKSSQATNRPFLSLVVAAYNEIENLKKLVPALVDQDYSNYEIIVALDRSTDGSKEYLTELHRQVSYIEIPSTPDDWDHKKFALTQGIAKASGEWIILTDADCLPSSVKWLESISKEITPKRDILIGVSPIISSGTFISIYAQFEGFMTYLLYLGITISYKPYMSVGRNMAFRKSFWEEKGGYLSIKEVKGGDDDLFIKLNANRRNTGLYLQGKESLVFTQSKKTWKAYFTQKMRHYKVSSSYKKKTNIILSTFHLLHIVSLIALISFISSSFFLPIILFYLFIKLVGYRFVVGKIGAGFNYILFPIVDIIYAFVTPVLGIWSQLKKDIKWKN